MDANLVTVLRLATERLAPVSPSPRLDAEVLLAHVLNAPRSHLYAHPELKLPAPQLRRFAALVTARRRGQPVAHLTQTREFWSLPLRVNAATLIPRPETELLVEEALRRIPSEARWHLADLGTGSGAIALALAGERPGCRVTATDISSQALAVAQDNAARLGLRNVEFARGEWFAPLAGRRFALITCNPPYVPDDDPCLAQGDLRFEPRLALSGGPDGLAAIRKIVLRAPFHLEPGGWLLLEHGHDQGAHVRKLLAAAGFGNLASHRDLAGQERLTLGSAG